jgi:hypothetical protein
MDHLAVNVARRSEIYGDATAAMTADKGASGANWLILGRGGGI